MAKRKLELVPEILPTPQRTPTSSVRERTLARLRALAAAATEGSETTATAGEAKPDPGEGTACG